MRDIAGHFVSVKKKAPVGGEMGESGDEHELNIMRRIPMDGMPGTCFLM